MWDGGSEIFSVSNRTHQEALIEVGEGHIWWRCEWWGRWEQARSIVNTPGEGVGGGMVLVSWDGLLCEAVKALRRMLLVGMWRGGRWETK